MVLTKYFSFIFFGVSALYFHVASPNARDGHAKDCIVLIISYSFRCSSRMRETSKLLRRVRFLIVSISGL